MNLNVIVGQILKFAGLWLRTQVFTHGQMYVALSRVGSPDNIKIALMKNKDNGLESVKNVVFKEVLLNTTVTHD